MASIIKIGDKWRAQVRRKGFPAETQTFTTKGRATAWAVKIEADMDAKKHQDTRLIASMTLGDLIDRYTDEIGKIKPFGRNKADVLKSLKERIGKTLLPALNVELLTKYVQARQAGGAGGVTIAIDLSYLGSVLTTAKALWHLPVDPSVTADARSNMKYLGLNPKSKERERRPTADEIVKICAYFAAKKRQKVPMGELIHFAIATAMRIGEIIRIKWKDLDDANKTVIIRDRKHPREKIGNDQEVPLLGEAFTIAKRQPRTDDRIFPVTDGTVSTLFPRACNALGIVDLTFHDLRHEGVSRLFEAGYRVEEVSLVSGHRDVKMLMRYVQLRAKDLHRAPVESDIPAQDE
jgi:integrase